MLTDLISMALKVAGYNVISMYSAQSALEVAKDEHFDLVISDIGMPGMSGYELAQQLRTLPGYESIPMIAITGFTQYSDRNKALEVGFNEHLKKPIDPLKLIELVKGFA
jgi:CheY-like chemotaxis protein